MTDEELKNEIKGLQREVKEVVKKQGKEFKKQGKELGEKIEAQGKELREGMGRIERRFYNLEEDYRRLDDRMRVRGTRPQNPYRGNYASRDAATANQFESVSSPIKKRLSIYEA